MAMQQMQPLTALGSLTETVRQQRMVLAQEGTHHQYAIKLTQRADRHAQPGSPGAGRVGSKIALAQTEIH